jgi:hypothetical protein
MTDPKRFSARLSCVPIALVAISVALSAPAVRAQSNTTAPSWWEIAVDPIMNGLLAVEARLASIEASVARFAGSFTTREINTRQLCVSDETGAQTCITKAQLDALLAKMGQAAAIELRAANEAPAAVIHAPAVVTEAPAIVTEAYVSPIVEPATVDYDWTYGSVWIRDAKACAALDLQEDVTAVAAAPLIGLPASSKVELQAEFVPALAETTVMTAPQPAMVPADREVIAPRDQEPATTGSFTGEPSRDALVWYPEVEISLPNALPSDE